MSYQDPYSSHRAAGSTSHYPDTRPQEPYGGRGHEYSNSYPPYQSYEDAGATGGYDAYASNNVQSYANDQPDYTYGDDQRAGYNDYPPPQRSATQNTKPPVKKNTPSNVSVFAAQKEASGFDNGEFTPKAQK